MCYATDSTTEQCSARRTTARKNRTGNKCETSLARISAAEPICGSRAATHWTFSKPTTFLLKQWAMTTLPYVCRLMGSATPMTKIENWCLTNGKTFVLYLKNGGLAKVDSSGGIQGRIYRSSPENGGSLQNGSAFTLIGGGMLGLGKVPRIGSCLSVAKIAFERNCQWDVMLSWTLQRYYVVRVTVCYSSYQKLFLRWWNKWKKSRTCYHNVVSRFSP